MCVNHTAIRNIVRQDLSLYVHIPFCEKKCDYCDFLSAPADDKLKNRYIEALLKEIKSYCGKAQSYLVRTIFFGGGTPSCIEASYIENIMKALKGVFTIDRNAEITIEINPGTIDRNKLEHYKKLGINRISFGLQSADPRELELLGRIHTYQVFVDNYRIAREVGFHNINIDLISGLPGQTLASWEYSLYQVINLRPEHISAYSLIIEEGTPFYERYGNQCFAQEQEDELDRIIYNKTKRILETYGYHSYEISNYAREGFQCKHNLTYWKVTDYLGLGLGASSLIQNTRFHNCENLNEYLQLLDNYFNSAVEPAQFNTWSMLQDCLGLRREEEVLSLKQQMEEFMFLGLRMTKGINLSVFEHRFHTHINSVYREVIEQGIRQGVISLQGDQLALTEYGVDISNKVLSEFLID